MKNHYIIKKGRVKNIKVLNDIMKRSIAIWDYSAKEIEETTQKLAITTESMDKSICCIVELNGLIKGFFCIEPSKSEKTSEAKFYIEPDSIREGLGTMLWKQIISELKNKEINFCELGVENGASVQMWENYFVNANLFAFEIDRDKIEKSKLLTKRTKFFETDVGNRIQNFLLDFPIFDSLMQCICLGQ